MEFFYWFVPSILKRILDVNMAISYVSSNQTFHSDLSLPEISPKEYSKITHSYIEKLVKLNPKPNTFFIKMSLYIVSFVKWVVLKILNEDWIET
jgi:hypothetical protein